MSLINKSSLNEIFNFCMLNVPVSAWVDFFKKAIQDFQMIGYRRPFRDLKNHLRNFSE